MAYMQYSFIDISKEQKPTQKPVNLNPFLMENCTKQIDAINRFFNGNSKLLLINGFMGTGKTAILNYSLSSLDANCIILQYNCFETTMLDDILLNFFEEFKRLTTLGKVNPPKTRSENFAQKINSYFESIDKPIVVVINSLEEVLKDNKADIIDFINHLCSINNVKVVLISRTFKEDNFNVFSSKVTILALEKSLFEKFLRSEDLKQIGPLSDELYKFTRGYFFYTDLSIKIMKLKNMKLIDFLDAFSKSFISFNDFILREALSLVDPVSGHLFRFLTVMRHPVSIKLLKTLQLYDEEKCNFFIDNLVLSKVDDSLYLQDYYKIIAENSIPENVRIKLHQGCVDLYNTQLPLKPLERDLLLSRQTMRNEIEYHSMFIPQQRPILKANEITPTTVYSESVEKVPESEIKIETTEQKDEQIKKMSFIFDEDEFGVLDTIADSIKNYMTYSDKRKEEEKEDSKLSLTELMNKAKQEESVFNYRHAASLYQKALLQNTDDDYYTYLPTIYSKLAFSYQNLSNWYEAQRYFEMARDFYISTGDTEKVCEAKYNIANIFYMTFKKDKAKALLSEIEKENVSGELKIKTYNLLASLSNDTNTSEKYYEKAVEYTEENVNKLVLAELYYKYASVLEDVGNDEAAIKYYEKCIGSKVDSEYMSGALSNIATMYDDMGDSNLAVRYYKESLKIDERTGNQNGIYSTSMKLAEIYAGKSPDTALEYYTKALEIAETLNENFYIVSSATALGDFYYNRKNDELAYKNYKKAYALVKDSQYKDNAEKIDRRIQDIKIRVGEERFNEFEK